ncbi:hypothetical protein CVT24_000178 [Panaeolus cyanescens]|uniref:RhoGAP-domain-containing protein n=1 Tax=Panaeolus cyanescens TaxID=181874 RepID=A0A409VWQ7_9AGAR|nr:hypothetical protein CVT24_000178 [Panaeolus cyanescens]
MLATNIPLREHSHLDIQQRSAAVQDPVVLDDRLCPGCKRSAVNEQGGLVVAFGQSFFHVDCFKCAKCRNQVTADTNLLLLSDGSPICANCSYSCNICRLPILDEAIMTGDDSYHAHCFKCKVCNNRIDELVFAKTSQGIYCMNCHNERMIKIRRHAQKKAERDRAQGSNSSSRSKDSEARNFHHNQEHRSLRSQASSSSRTLDERVTAAAQSSTPPNLILPPSSSHHPYSNSPTTSPKPPSKSNTLPVQTDTNGTDSKRRNTVDSETRPSNAAHRQDSLNPNNNITDNLSVTPRKDKRRSINPGLSLQSLKENGHDQSYSDPSARPSHSSETLIDAASRPSSHTQTLSSEDGSIDNHFQSPSISNSRSTNSLRSSADTILTQQHPHPETLSPTSINGFQPRKRSSSASNQSLATTISRSNSPSYRADVPHGIESETDTEPENDTVTLSRESNNIPPALPPKDATDTHRLSNGSVSTRTSPKETEDVSEESATEQTSRSTYIAPALPPIRFSVNDADFSRLLNSVNVGEMPTGVSTKEVTQSSTSISSPALSTPSGTPASLSSTPSISVTSLSDNEDTLTIKFEQDEEQEPHSKADASRQPLNISFDEALSKLKEASESSRINSSTSISLDTKFVESLVECLEGKKREYNELKHRIDGINRESRHYIEGLTVAQVEYDRELKARRDAEAEVTRLRVLLSGQAIHLTAMSGDKKRQEIREQLSKEISDNLSGLEQDLSRLKAERDLTLAEMEELSASKGTNIPEPTPVNLSRSLTRRLEGIRHQYERELTPLLTQKELLNREITELKAVRDVFLEETTVLNARNEELARLSAVYTHRLEGAPEIPAKDTSEFQPSEPPRSQTPQPSNPLTLTPSLNSTSTSITVHEDNQEHKSLKPQRLEHEVHTPAKQPKFKWPGSKPKETIIASPSSHVETSRGKAHIEHNFQQLSILRFTRCDHCGDKMWGSQLRCTVCAASIHVRCIANLQLPCTQHQQQQPVKDEAPVILPPSMFGRDLIEQVRSDSKEEERQVPIIVEKCIEAVEARALDYEGIYRKTGGLSQSKAITQLFERGDYDSFDLCDSDRFNDICSVTSVLKTYFRSLPIPLLTFDLHDEFMAAVAIRETAIKQQSLTDLINKLPYEHYFTLRSLMLHLNHIHERCDRNLMTARNLGVVFGRTVAFSTLMKSADPGAEFNDMAGKALFVEWLVENAPIVFKHGD